MTKEMALYIFILFLTVIIVLKIFKSIVAGMIALIIGVMIFRIGWVYNADEFFDKYNLRNILNNNQQEKLYDAYDKFTNRRDQYSIIDTDAIDQKISEKEEIIKQELERKIQEKTSNEIGK